MGDSVIEELASVVLTANMPENGLQAGDIGTVVMVHQQGTGYTVEFMTLSGETVAVVTVPSASIRPIRTVSRCSEEMTTLSGLSS